MPRNCGCSGASCACRLVSSDGSIDISGSGSAQNPYDLSAGTIGLGGRLQVQDSDTINLSISGSGSVEDPYVISGEATLDLGDLGDVDDSDTTVGYVLARQAGGGFALDPPSTAPVGAITTGVGLSGDGSGGDPLLVDDWANLARLEGSPDSPNEQWLVIGSLTEPDVYGVRIQREADVTDSIDTAAVELRLYDYGTALGAATVLFQDSIEVARMTLRGDASVQMSTGVDAWGMPWKQLTGDGVISLDGVSGAALNVAFPAGYFTATPRIFLTSQSTSIMSASEQQFILNADNKSTGGFRAIARQARDLVVSGIDVEFSWHAIQFSSA